MQPSTETIQTPPAHPRTSRSSPATLPSRGAPDRFGNALTHALAPSGPAATAKPADTTPAAPIQIKTPLDISPTPPPTLTTTKATTAVSSDKPTEGEPASSATGSKQDEPPVDASKTLDVVPSLLQAQPLSPAPLLALVAPAQTTVAPSGVTEAASSDGTDAALPTALGSVGCQPASTLTAAVAQPAPPPASALPPHAAAPSGADVTAVHTATDRILCVATEDKSAADLLGAAAEAVPVPSVVLTASLIAASPAIAVPHYASALPAAPTHSSAAGGPPASVASQVGPALASFAASAAHSGAPQSLVIRLDPMELGRVQVRIKRSPDGSARVDLVVERPDTLLLLLRDQPQLHRALDLAGVPSTDRTLQFHLTPPGATTPSPMSPQSNADHGPGQHQPGQPQSNRSTNSGRSTTSGTVFSLGDSTTRPAAPRRAGVDITA